MRHLKEKDGSLKASKENKYRMKIKQRIENRQRKIHRLKVGSLERSTKLINLAKTSKKKGKTEMAKIKNKNKKGDIVTDVT